jgi:hypothetical protein
MEREEGGDGQVGGGKKESASDAVSVFVLEVEMARLAGGGGCCGCVVCVCVSSGEEGSVLCVAWFGQTQLRHVCTHVSEWASSRTISFRRHDADAGAEQHEDGKTTPVLKYMTVSARVSAHVLLLRSHVCLRFPVAW